MKKLFKVSKLTIPYDNIYIYVEQDPHAKNRYIVVRHDYGTYSYMHDNVWNTQAPDEELYDKSQFIGYLFRSAKLRNIDFDKLISAVKLAAGYPQKRELK